MRNFTNTLLFALITLVAWLLVLQLKDKKTDVPIIGPNSVTDTIYSHTKYILSPTTLPKWNPNIIINFPKAKIDTNIHYHYVLSDSLLKVIDSLHGVVNSYNLAFLTNFPTSSKLLLAKVSLDSLKFDLLFPDASIRSERYKVNLEKYNYTYENNTLGYKVRKRPFTKDNIHYDAFGSYDIINKQFQVSVRPNIEYRKILLYGQAQTNIANNPYLRLEVGAGYRFK